jgi:ABC-type phosphate/phosphonate transport system substrate-binding protein
MRRSHATVIMIAASMVATALLLASCGSSTTVHNRLVPQAQAEADLKRALDAGIISQSEYQDQLEELRESN